TLADAVRPRASLAVAVTVCDPAASRVASTRDVHDVVPVALTQEPPSTWTRTAVRPAASAAVPGTLTLPLPAAPLAGAGMAIAGPRVFPPRRPPLGPDALPDPLPPRAAAPWGRKATAQVARARVDAITR